MTAKPRDRERETGLKNALIRAARAARKTACIYGTPIFFVGRMAMLSPRDRAPAPNQTATVLTTGDGITVPAELPMAYLCHKPINMRWGKKTLTALCKESLGVETAPERRVPVFQSEKKLAQTFL